MSSNINNSNTIYGFPNNNSSNLTDKYGLSYNVNYNLENIKYLIPKRDIKIFKNGLLVNEGSLTIYNKKLHLSNPLFIKNKIKGLGNYNYISILPNSKFYRINQSTSQGLLDYHEKNFTNVCDSNSQTWLSYYNRICEFLDPRRGGQEWQGKQYLSCYKNICQLNFIILCSKNKNNLVYKLIKKTNLLNIITENTDLKIISLFSNINDIRKQTINLFKFCFGCWGTTIKEQYKILLIIESNLIKIITKIINNTKINNLLELINYLDNNKDLYKNKDIIELIGKPSLNNLTTLDEINKFKNNYKNIKNNKLTNQRLSIYRIDQLTALIICKLTSDYNMNGWYFPNIKSEWIPYNNEEFVILGMYKYFIKETPNVNIKRMFSLLKKNIKGQQMALVGKKNKISKKKKYKNKISKKKK